MCSNGFGYLTSVKGGWLQELRGCGSAVHNSVLSVFVHYYRSSALLQISKQQLCLVWLHLSCLLSHGLEAMASDGEEKKVFSLQEVGQHVTLDDCWMVIHGKVYDVTKFMDDHPGGDDVLMQVAGKDASEEFDDVGHSKSAMEQLKDFYAGECLEVLEKKVASVAAADSKLGASDSPSLTNGAGIFSKVLQFLVPLVLLGVAVALRKYAKRDNKN